MKSRGFTIVELLIVIVVIAILAAITIVAYNGIRERTLVSSVQSALSQANKKVLAYAALNSDNYPATLADAGVSNTGSAAFQYSVDNSVSPRQYAITASNGLVGTTVYFVTNGQSTPSAGIAPGHNLIVWDKTQGSTAPVNISTGVSIDTSVFRTSAASVRIATGATGKYLRSSPITGLEGQTVTVSLWLLSDSGWNGTSGNSKIRFGAASGGTYISACAYNGATTVWKYFTCSYTLTAANTSVAITVGNDGAVGNIWLDDVSISIQ